MNKNNSQAPQLPQTAVKRCVFTIVNEWKDDLIWCPSQCYLDIMYKERHFVIYLRWRHSDPWTADIVECPNDGKFDMHELNNWNDLVVKEWKDTELKELKEEIVNVVNNWLLEHIS